MLRKKLLYVTIFAIAMAFFESAVVIYLRELMYPGGFQFPLAPISPHLALTEILRETSTLVMLVMIGVLAARSLAEGFAWFLYTFAVWDIFFYIFLKLVIGWPESIMTWDILFLIPTTWTGPVLSPVLVSLLMILLSMIILIYSSKRIQVKIRPLEWTGLILGSLVLILAFTWDYSRFILDQYRLSEIFTLPDKTVLYDYAIKYVPVKFPWGIFIPGYLLIFTVIIFISRRFRREHTGLNGLN